MMRHIAANALTLFIPILIAIGGVIAWAQSEYKGDGPLADPIVFEVERGQGLASVARNLEDQGAISNQSIFRMAARYQKRDQSLKFGEYNIPAGSSMASILDILTSGRSIQYRVTIAEGLTSFQVVEKLKAVEVLVGEVEELPPEGSLAPNTYQVLRGENRAQVIARMQAAQTKLLEEAWAARDPEVPLKSAEDALILASIVEKETGVAEERGLVASVFVNRLRQGMRLQTDPTVIYGITLGKGPLGRGLTRSELRKPTPYNTYVIQGLPPTPIANPGKAAIEATLNPPESRYRFFVADGTGGHAFAETLTEHNLNVRRWRQIEAERKKQNQ
jgi:UPF0755 protein